MKPSVTIFLVYRMSKLIDYSYMKYSLHPHLYNKHVNTPLVEKYKSDALIGSYVSRIESELKDTKEAYGILLAQTRNVEQKFKTLELATDKWTYDIMLATTVLFCILAFTYMLLIYNDITRPFDLCLY